MLLLLLSFLLPSQASSPPSLACSCKYTILPVLLQLESKKKEEKMMKRDEVRWHTTSAVMRSHEMTKHYNSGFLFFSLSSSPNSSLLGKLQFSLKDSCCHGDSQFVSDTICTFLYSPRKVKTCYLRTTGQRLTSSKKWNGSQFSHSPQSSVQQQYMAFALRLQSAKLPQLFWSH